MLCRHNHLYSTCIEQETQFSRIFSSPKDPLPQTAFHPLKAVPIAMADDEDSESEDDELTPRGIIILTG